MIYEQREMLVARLVSGHFRFKIDGEIFVLKSPSPDTIVEASELYFRVLEQALSEEVYTSDDALDLMIEEKLWSTELAKEMDTLSKDIDKLKKELYRAAYRSGERLKIKKYLSKAKERLEELAVLKNSLNTITAEYIASSAKTRFLLGDSLYRVDGSKYWLVPSWDAPDNKLDKVIEKYSELSLSEEQIREIARTEPWRSLWACRKSGSPIFAVPTSAFSNDQKNVVLWSNIYDNIYEADDCPPDDFFEDNDMIDGWLLIKSEARKKNQSQSLAESFTQNEKIKNSQEIYIPADSKEDVARIADLNDEMAKATKRKRSDAIRRKGSANEVELPDVAQRLSMQMAQMQFNKG